VYSENWNISTQLESIVKIYSPRSYALREITQLCYFDTAWLIRQACKQRLMEAIQDMSAPSIVRPLMPANADLKGGAHIRMPRRIVLLNVKYSPNLGDGLLSECLERELGRSLPGCEVVSIDLAGRTAYPRAHGRARGAVLALLERCPSRLRRTIAGTMLRLLLAVRLRGHYRRGLRGADAVVVGGGNLLTDSDLNFPLKISAALGEAARSYLPVAVHAVGVSPEWSRPGGRMFGRTLERARLARCSVRDHRSQDNWAAHFSNRDILPATIAVDPGVLASLWYPANRRPTDAGSRRIGLCVTDPLAVRYHASEASAATLDTWYPAALRSLVESGFQVVLFTNGSPEDREYLYGNVSEWIRKAKGAVTLGRSFDTPQDLAALVSNCDAVIGHRMHACIAAYSYAVPAIGLRWDPKLDSFFELTGRKAHMLDPANTDAGTVGRRTAAAITDGVDPVPLIARARAQIAAFANDLTEACSRGHA
jgi:hypothetical protein